MLKREWQKISKNPWMIIILIAIITIPAIYTSVFLGSMWDPYGDADQLPVAVVNHDKKVNYEGKTLQVGDDLVKNLKDSGSLDFHFVSDKKAEEGLKSGEYYMIISIPENFSKNATTLMDKNPKQMKLTYKTNPGTNYVASKMDDSAIAKIEKSVREKVTETYVKTVFDQIMRLKVAQNSILLLFLFCLDRSTKTDALAILTVLDHLFDARKGTAAEEQNVLCVHLNKLLMGVLAPSLRRHIRHSSLKDLQQGLLNT